MKNILFISARFFSIEDHIIDELKKQGHNVHYRDERINNKNITKVMTRKFPKLMKPLLKRYYDLIFDEIEPLSIDIIIIIKAETMPMEFLINVKNKYPHIKIILYMYDPLANYPQIIEKSKHVDKLLTFDKNDSVKYNGVHRPLFFPPNMPLEHFDLEECPYSGSFVGTLHTDRGQVMFNILNSLSEDIKKITYIYFYTPLQAMYLLGKYITRAYKDVPKEIVHSTPLNSKETYDMMNKSKFVIDIHHDEQSGLTTRTLETVGLRKKLVTTNPSIKEYDFYDPHNILVVDKFNPVISLEWINAPYKPINEEIYNSYTVTQFVKDLLEEN